MKKVRKHSAVLLFVPVLALLALPALAQNGSTLNALNIERVLSLSNIHSTLPPTAPANVLAAIAGGALEIHEQISFNSAGNFLTLTDFGMPAGSPLPTPPGTDLTASTLQLSVIPVDKVYVTKTSVMITGVVTQNPVNAYGLNASGTPAVVSFGYTSDTPPKIHDVAVVGAGYVDAYSAAAAGTLTINQTAPPTPPSGSGAPTVVFTPSGTVMAIFRQIRLDASKSTDPNNLPLTYSWKVMSPPSATIVNPTSATPDVQLNNGFGVYTFQVTVTNSAGMSTTATQQVQYIGR